MFFTQEDKKNGGNDTYPVNKWSSKVDGRARKLGLLAGVFADGTVSVFIVPDPEDLPSQNAETPIYG